MVPQLSWLTVASAMEKLAPIARTSTTTKHEPIRIVHTGPRPTTTASANVFTHSLPKMNLVETKRPQTTYTRESRDPSRSNSSLSAPSSHRDMDVAFDDKTYISLLKSDVLLCQKRINDILGKNFTSPVESTLSSLNFSFNSTIFSKLNSNLFSSG
jgi:hypothetical protein